MITEKRRCASTTTNETIAQEVQDPSTSEGRRSGSHAPAAPSQASVTLSSTDSSVFPSSYVQQLRACAPAKLPGRFVARTMWDNCHRSPTCNACRPFCDALHSLRYADYSIPPQEISHITVVARGSPTNILNEDTHPVLRAIGVSHTDCKYEFHLHP